MKKQIVFVIAGLLISAAVIAQAPQQDQTRAQSGVRTQDQYNNQGQITRAQKQARNAERKALKQQQKQNKMQEAAQRRTQYREQDKDAARNGAARPAIPQGNAARMQRGSGAGRR